MPLSSGLQRIADRIVAFHDSGGEAPYQLYVYDPRDEWQVRRELKDLELWLRAPGRGIRCAAISLASLLWQALDEQGWLVELVEAERTAGGDPAAMAEVSRGVAEVLRLQPTLPDRVCAKIDELTNKEDPRDQIAVFLYRAGALYPAYRTSALLDDLLGRVRQPVTLLYPGSLVGEGLRFMGVCEATYGYRALKVHRGNSV